MRNHIAKLINYRKFYEIKYDSNRTTLAATSSVYAAQIDGEYGNLIVAIGNGYNVTDSSYTLMYSGTNFKIWGNKNYFNPVISCSEDWIWNENCKVFAKATTLDETKWIECTGNYDTSTSKSIINATLPAGTTSLTLYRCPSDTTTATAESATKHNTSNAISVNCKTLTYNVTWN